eukprot:3634086-Heterocapsa_arctica.AAC.1
MGGHQALVKRSPCSRKGCWLGTTGKHVVPGWTHGRTSTAEGCWPRKNAPFRIVGNYKLGRRAEELQAGT